MTALATRVNTSRELAALPLRTAGTTSIGAATPVLATPAAFAAGVAGAAGAAGAFSAGFAIGQALGG